ncbi:TIGR04561 family membrane protein [Spiroplasma endosymbiont of Labia minor]|uniref:TIGR04561 family membrane protein n=1 Tax=Spiroplasma endosymbiont of Labia minor TaxID=3066305 RepID=UPI0030D00D32
MILLVNDKGSNRLFYLLDWSIPLEIILIVFFVIALLALILFFLAMFKKPKSLVLNRKNLSREDFKKVEKFNDLKNDFELELAQIKKAIRNKK